ncbi:MAG: aldose 1-epimerase [Novosphingobium sp.]
MSGRLVLRAGALEAQLLPQAGGSVARFDRIVGADRQPLLRGTDAEDAGPLDCGCFPLVPYCNRIRGGAFSCDGRQVTLAPNMLPDPSPLHGQGWLARWEVCSSSDAEAELSFVHPAGEWPWSYEARQHFVLDADSLSITLACRNLSERPMPCGLGFHPYYVCDERTRLDTGVECAWTVDADVLPVERVPATGRYDLRERPICGQGLDNGFGGWSGWARIDWPGNAASLRLRAEDASYFQVYSPESGGLFAAEPVQHANAALNAPQDEWAGLGIRLLGEGEQRDLRVRFEVIAED